MRMAPLYACSLLACRGRPGCRTRLPADSCEWLATLFHCSLRHSCRYTNFEPVSGNGHGRPIHAYADSSPGLSLPFERDRCPLVVTAIRYLTTQCSSFLRDYVLAGVGPVSRMPTAPQFTSPFSVTCTGHLDDQKLSLTSLGYRVGRADFCPLPHSSSLVPVC